MDIVFDINKIRKEFEFLKDENIDNVGKKIIYFDSAATSQKPNCVLDSVLDYYKFSNSNTGRSAHFLGDKATKLLEESRGKVAEYINSNIDEIIFTKSATESINLVASTWGKDNLEKDDEIITTILEHHANFVPWQELSKDKGFKINIVELDNDNNLKFDDIFKFLNKKTKLVTITAASNVTAEIIDLEMIIKKIKEYNKDIVVLVDATQLLAHRKINIKNIDCDFLVFSGHKIYGPMGIGVLFGKKDLLEKMRPYQYGGQMIEYVYKDKTKYQKPPMRFEAGTLNIGGIVGLKRAIEWMEEIGLDNIKKHEDILINYLLDKIKDIENIQIFRSNKETLPLVSFNFTDIHAHDITTILDSYSIATRSGHHCAMALHTYLNTPATTRVSLSVFNTKEEIDIFVEKLKEIRKVMGK